MDRLARAHNEFMLAFIGIVRGMNAAPGEFDEQSVEQAREYLKIVIDDINWRINEICEGMRNCKENKDDCKENKDEEEA